MGGIVIELDKINWLERITPFDDDFIKEKELSNEQRILKEKDRYEFLKSLPVNISVEEYEDIELSWIMDSL